MRVLLINQTARDHNGGMNRVVVECCALLSGKGHHVGLVHFDDSPADVACPTIRVGHSASLEVLSESVAGFQPDLVYMHFSRQSEELQHLSENWPTAVFLHDQTWFCSGGDRADSSFNPCTLPHGPACLAWNYLKGCGGKHPHGNYVRWLRTNNLLKIRGMPRLRIQVASRFMAEGLIQNRVDAARIDVVSLFGGEVGMDANAEPGLLFLPSRLVRAKGVGVAIQALHQIRHYPWRLVIAGDGMHSVEIKAEAARLGLKDRISFLGEVKAAVIREWYSRCEVVLFPVLRREPFGLIGVEALAHGKPIVAFDGGGVEEWLWHGETGLKVQQRTPEAFAEAIRWLLTHPAERNAMGHAAKARYPFFHPTAFVERLEAAFERTIRWHRETAPR